MKEDRSRQAGPSAGIHDVRGSGDRGPRATLDALTRARLLTAVQSRWNRPVTAVIGGAGFGKSTLIAQAVEENRLARAGLDVVLRCEPGDASALRLAARLLAELRGEQPRFADTEDLLELVVDELWARAPTNVGLVLDDVHELEPDSTGLALLRQLIRARPGNTHLLLGSRSLPEVGVARLAVAGEALVLRESDLRFTETEVGEFARLRGVDPDRLVAADGWPALAELLARTVGIAPGEYVWEQVIGPLTSAQRARLVEVAALGGADDEMASAVAGTTVNLAELLGNVPLAGRTPEGWWELHELVAEPMLARESENRVADIRRRGGLHAEARGEVDRALRLFVAAGARAEVLGILREHFVELGPPEDPSLAAQWTVLLPESLATEPEVLLLRTIGLTVTDPERAFAAGEDAVAAFADRGDVDGELAAFGRLAAISFGLADTRRIAPHVRRIAELAETGHPWAVAFEAVCRGAFALMTGDWRQAEAVLAPLVADPSSDPTQGVAAYLCARAQATGGRLREAARTLRAMPDDDRRRVRDGVLGVEATIAQGLGSADAVFDELRATAESRVDRRPLVARRNARCHIALALAMGGDLDGARRQLMELELIGPPIDATLEEELLAGAAVAVAAGSEDEAAALLARLPERSASQPLLEALTLYYVLREDRRERYDALDIEGVHAQRRAFAAAFVAARAGDPEPLGRYDWPAERVVRWLAPAPWLVEAAVISASVGGSPPAELVQHLGRSQRHVLQALSRSTFPSIAQAGAAFAAALGPAAPGDLAVRVLGPIEVDVNGEPTSSAELRRERVRALLGLLVLRRTVSRAEAAGSLWPDLAGDQALANLRVTLTHLLKLIEPSRDKHAQSFFVHQMRDRLTLRDDRALVVDVWEFESAVTRAVELERAGTPSLALEALVRSVELWRGPLLADLRSYEWLDFERIRLGNLLTRSALRAGELLAAQHELGPAAAMAERVIAADRWSEPGFRLLASIHLEQGDRTGARRILQHLRQVLADLDVEPEPPTVRLLRRCGVPVNDP